MPITLAHPVVALPFRRWSPRYFDFSAVIIGSLAPDVANPLPGWDYFTHSVRGSILFCLPLSLAALLLFHRIRALLVATMPQPHRDFLMPNCKTRTSSLFVVIVSLLIGIWSHIIWDLFTHNHSPVAQSLGSLPFSLLGRDQISLNRLIWIVSSGGGILYLAGAYLIRIRRWPGLPCSILDLTAYTRWFSIISFPGVAATVVTYFIYVANTNHRLTSHIREIAEFYFPFLYITLFSFAALSALTKATPPIRHLTN